MTVETPDSSPSALSFICPRSQSVGVIEDFRLSSINCNLLTDFESCTGHRHPMEVYLRIRPYVYDNEVTNKVLSCSDAYTVIACPPEADGQKHPSRNFQKSANKFTFNGIFRESATQAKVFEVVAADKVSAFIDGLNGLIFAYGTTSSGKTYTLQGSRNDAGIIPRSLYSIFSLVKHCSDPSLMPRDFSDVVYLSEDEVQKVLAGKSNLIKLSEGIFEMTSLPDDEKGLMSLKDTFKGRSSDLRCIGNIRFSFWISFVEIYNETFYDLLDPVQCSSMLTMASDGTGNIRTTHKQTNFRNIFSVNNNVSDTSSFANYLRRTSLELRTDKNGNLFVKGVKWYPICSPEEGLRLVAIGRQCQKVASTRLNQASSRSHSILFIKAVRVADKSNPNFARVSTLMFCDLAGSERTVKAATAGQVLRIREAGNINSSLLTLGRCIEAVRYNQVHPDNPKLVPYRDSKLTRLFQGFFTGQGRACMIVNASPNPELFGETLHALRFAALAKQVIVEANPVTETAISDRSKVEAKPRFKIIKDIKSYRGNVIISKEPGSLVEAQPTLWSGDDFERKTSSEEGVKGETISLVESDYMCVSKANTSSSDDGMQLILDHFNKGELIGLVKDLSEQLFEAKGELVEQEARLRAEMCDNMNQQMIDFEKKFEEILKARENDVYKESSRRMCNIIETVNQRHARLVTNAKRYCPDDSKCSSDDDISETDDSIQKHFKAKEDTLVCECCSVQKRKVTQLSETLKESENRVAELEGDLADEKDVIKNLMHEVDRLRLENRRLEFTISQQLNKLKFDKKIQTEPVEHAVSPRSSSKAYDLDDSCVVVNLNKEMHPSTPTDHVIEN
ncbi:unnamed protein product [Heterobilharzia americana]|nr:unnamed protein product [Heterobilharzia americana]